MINNKLKIYSLALLFCITWSSASIAGKMAIVLSPPLVLLTIRLFIGGILMFFYSKIILKEKWPNLKSFLILVVLGVLNNTIYLSMVFCSLKTISAALVVVLISTNSIFTAVIAHFVLKEKITLRKISGIIIGVIGVILLTWQKITIDGMGQIVGIVMAMIGVVAFSCGTVLYRKFNMIGSPFMVNSWTTLIGGFALLPFALFFEDIHAIHWTLSFFAIMFWLVVVVSFGAVMIWFILIKETDAATASSAHFLSPFLGIIQSYFILGEPVTIIELLTIIPISLSIFLIIAPAQSHKKTLQPVLQ